MPQFGFAKPVQFNTHCVSSLESKPTSMSFQRRPCAPQFVVAHGRLHGVARGTLPYGRRNHQLYLTLGDRPSHDAALTGPSPCRRATVQVSPTFTSLEFSCKFPPLLVLYSQRPFQCRVVPNSVLRCSADRNAIHIVLSSAQAKYSPITCTIQLPAISLIRSLRCPTTKTKLCRQADFIFCR